MHLGVDQRYVQVRRGVPRQQLLRRPGAPPKVLPCLSIGRRSRSVEPRPLRRRACGEASSVTDERRVEIQTTDVVQPVVGYHLERVTTRADDADVEGAGAEVVHDQATVPAYRMAKHPGVVHGRGD